MPNGDCWDAIGKIFTRFEEPVGEGLRRRARL